MNVHDDTARVGARRATSSARSEAARGGAALVPPATVGWRNGGEVILDLQRTVGNAALARVLAPSRPRTTEGASVNRWLQRMSVGGVNVPSGLDGATALKHVVADAAQAAAATAAYGDRTFVRAANVLTDAVDANVHNFAAGGARSARQDIAATVTIDEWQKATRTPVGFAAGEPSSRAIANTATACEIGAVKTGDGRISITHFKKA